MRKDADGFLMSDRVFNTSDILNVYRELIENGKEVRLNVCGYSMEPFLKEGRDSVLLKKCDRPLKKGDIAMYVRENGRYILHRVVKTDGESCFFAGDAQTFVEGPLNISCVFARVSEVYRKGKTLEKGDFTWAFFEKVWLFLLPIRGFLLKFMRSTIYRKQSDNNEKS